MTFCKLAEIFCDISKENSRLNITQKLKDLYCNLSSQEAQIVTYLALGNLGPDYETNNQFNFAQKNLEKILSKILNLSNFEERLKKAGDLSLLIDEENWPYEDKNLDILEVYNTLQSLKLISGNKSQEQKSNLIINLLEKVNSISAKFIIKIILSTMRLGFSHMTIIDALSHCVSNDKSLKQAIEDKYNICTDLGLIAYIIKEHGMQGVELIQTKVGTPIRPAAAERASSSVEIINRIGSCVAQPKLDGFRLQIHVDFENNKDKIWFYSRNLQDMSFMFPDLSKELFKLKDYDVKNIILEGEAIVYDEITDTFLPFQETVKRKRKHNIDQVAQDLPLKFFAFDILYINNQNILDKKYYQRREILSNIFKLNRFNNTLCLIEEQECLNAQELSNYFNKNITQGLEGIVVKRKDTVYKAGKRNFNWIKLKREQGNSNLKDTIDAVILGYYKGKGRRAAFEIGAFLVGIYNNEKDMFQTIAKIGTGLKDQDWLNLKELCNKIKLSEKPHNVECSPELEPDIWVNPELVVIILADEITQSPLHSASRTESLSGLALRFPRFINYSLDKTPQQSTNSQEIRRLYGMQFEKI